MKHCRNKMKQCKEFSKRFLAGLCVLAMLVSSVGPSISAAAQNAGDSRKKMERDMEATIKEGLKNEDPAIKKDHPKGIFSFATLQGQVDENNKEPLAVYLVRHGGTEGKQKVGIKFSDYSAEYGKDYYAKLSDSVFAEQVEANPDSVPLFYMFEDGGNGDGQQTAVDEESLIKAYGEERGKKIFELTKEYAEAQEEAEAAESDAKSSEEATDANTSEEATDTKSDANTSEEADAKSDEKATDAKSDAKSSKKAKKAAEAEEKAEEEKAASPLDQLVDETSQYTDSGYATTMEELLANDELNESTATYGAEMLETIFPGAETELVFEDGEIIKKIYIYPIDNKVASGDRVFNVQINGGSEDLAWQEGENAATVTILDDEEDETAGISITDSKELIGDDNTASVTLQRKKGLYKVSTVEYVVKAAGKELAKGNVIFMPGMEEKTVEFSVGDVNAKTVDNIRFVLQNPVGAEISGSKSRNISLTRLKINKGASTSSKDVSEDESPVGMNGTLALDGIDLDLRNFKLDESAGCDNITFSASESEMKLHLAQHGCFCQGARVAATLKNKINLEAIESISVDCERDDQDGSPCNRMWLMKYNKANGADYDSWEDSRQGLMAAKDDQGRDTITVHFADGSADNFRHDVGYKNDYMKYKEGKEDIYTPFTIASKKTSGGINGMKTTVYGVRLNFRNYDMEIIPPEAAEGHDDPLGDLTFAKTETPGQNTDGEVYISTRYAYQKVIFHNSPATYAYLDHLEIGDDTPISAEYVTINGDNATLDMNNGFFEDYKDDIDSANSKIKIKPVYAQKSVEVSISADQHGGIVVNDVQYPRGTKDKKITVHEGDKLEVKTYDVEEGYNFSKYEMVGTPVSGNGDNKIEPYTAEEPDNMLIEDYNYTLKPYYTNDGTTVVVKVGDIPTGCSIGKTKWTYGDDKIHSGQILTIQAEVARNFRAKWTITSDTHEWSGKTLYGETLYHKVAGPIDEISLEFERCDNMQFVSVSGKTLKQDATILNPPFSDADGVYTWDYVPVANASVQMGEFSSLTKEDGSYTLYSHTESAETAGQNKAAAKQQEDTADQKETASRNKAAAKQQEDTTDQKETAGRNKVAAKQQEDTAIQKETASRNKAAAKQQEDIADQKNKDTASQEDTVIQRGMLSRTPQLLTAENEESQIEHSQATKITNSGDIQVLTGEIEKGTGYYELEEDIDGDLDIDGHIMLCLHGHKITGQVLVEREGIFDIYDCQGTGEIYNLSNTAVKAKQLKEKDDEDDVPIVNLYSGTIRNESEEHPAVEALKVSVYGGKIEAKNNDGVYIPEATISSSYCYISDGEITGGKNGVYAASSSEMDVNGGKISGGSYAIYGAKSMDCTVNGSEISGGSYGIYGKDSIEFTMNSGKISGGYYGICSTKSMDCTMNGGEISGGSYGIYGADSMDCTVSGGDISGGSYGIYGADSMDCIVSGGGISGGSYGICSAKQMECTVSGGEIQGTEKGSAIALFAENSILRLMGGILRAPEKYPAVYCEKTDSQLRISGNYTGLFGGTAEIETRGKIYIDSKLQKGEQPYRVKAEGDRLDIGLVKGWGKYMPEDTRISDYFILVDSDYEMVLFGNDLALINQDVHVDHSQAAGVNNQNSQILSGEAEKSTAYYLEEDVNGNIAIEGHVLLCLNGHRISGQVTVKQGGTFDICDCQGTGEIYNSSDTAIKSEIPNDSSDDYPDLPRVNLYSGTIRSESKNNPAVETLNANIYGGKIENKDYVGIHSFVDIDFRKLIEKYSLEGAYNIYDGEIIGGEAGVYTGSQYVALNVNGGKISGVNNGIDCGGECCIVRGGEISADETMRASRGIDASSSTIHIADGKISGFYGIYGDYDGDCTVSGGEISGSYGIYCNNGVFCTVKGGVIKGTAHEGIYFYGVSSLQLSGGTVEADAADTAVYCNNSYSDIYIMDDYTTLSAKTADIYTGGYIYIRSELKKGKNPYRINASGRKQNQETALTIGWGRHMPDDTRISDYFMSADIGYGISRFNDELYLTQSDPHRDHDYGRKLRKDATLMQDDYYYLDSDIETGAIVVEGDVTLCLNGHTLDCMIEVAGDANFNICDCQGTGKIYNPDGAPIISHDISDLAPYLNVISELGFFGWLDIIFNFDEYWDDFLKEYPWAFEPNAINLYGGTISGNGPMGAQQLSVYGGKIETNVNAYELKMFGGEIADIITNVEGIIMIDGKVDNIYITDAICIVNGGEIAGGIYSSDGSCTVNGGKIDSGIDMVNGDCTITGGEIGKTDGMGIRVHEDGVLRLIGGTVKGAISAVHIGDESRDELEGEIHISGDYTSKLDGGEQEINLHGTICIDSKLKKGEQPCRIFVNQKMEDKVLTSGWGKYMSDARVSDYFVSVNSDYEIVRSGDELVAVYVGNPNDNMSVDPDSGNVTTYLKAGPNETRTVKVIHNGLEYVKYIKITNDFHDLTTSQSDPLVMTKIPALELSFFGRGPIPDDIDVLLGTVDKDTEPFEISNTPGNVEMRNYSVGFSLKLRDVFDENGENLIDKVNFYIYNKDNVMKTVHTVEREIQDQTTYTLKSYPVQDDEGKVGYMKLNGLLDFADQDKIYVELVGSMKDENGNKVEDADMSYGMYDSGIRFQEMLDVVQVQLKDIEPSDEESNSGIPTVDILGPMMPTVKLGKMTVSAVISKNSMEFTVGFNVKDMNKGIYDSWEAEKAQKVKDLDTEIEAESTTQSNKKMEKSDKQEQYDDKCKESEALAQIENPSEEEIELYGKLNSDIAELDKQIQTLDKEIKTLDKSIQDKTAQRDELKAPPKEQKDPMEPATAADAESLNVTDKVTPDEVSNPEKVTSKEVNPIDANKLWKDMKDNLRKAADKSGITKPKEEGVQGHGTISASLGVDIGVTVRLKTVVLDSGNAEWCFDKALVYLKVSGGVSAMYYFVIPDFPIPLYAGASFTASVGLYAGMGATQNVTLNEMGEEEFDGSTLYFSGDIPVTLGIEGFVGMGLKSLLALELGVGFLQKFDFAYTSHGDQIGTGMSSFYGYVQTNVLFFSYRWKFAQANWNYELYNTTDSAERNLKKLMQDSGLGSDAALSEFTVGDTPKVHYYGEAKKSKLAARAGASYSANDSTVLAEGLSQTVSDVVPLGDGKYLMAFEGVRAEADCPADMKPDSADYDYNSRAVYLSYYNGTEWSTPVILQKDDTLDTGLQVEEMGDDILISWSSADRRFTKEEIVTGKKTEDGEDEIKADAAVKVLSSLDVYAAVLKKSEVESFVKASAEDRNTQIDRLTQDQGLTDAQRQKVEANLAEGAEYMGYGHENGQAVSVGDQIYLFYDTIDYNHWKNGEKSENLSDIVDANGYIFYKIYDKKTGKWMEDYADNFQGKEVYEKLGFTMGQRVADVHLNVLDSDGKILPMVSQMDAQTVKVKGEDRVALTYLVDSDGNSSETMEDQMLFIAFMKPAEVSGGAVKAEAEWSEPMQMNTELSHITNPQMMQTKNGGKDNVYLVWADDNRLMYSNLTQFFQEVKMEQEEAGGDNYTPVEVSTTELENGKKVEVYTMKEGIEPKIAILGDDENGFQYNNGYRLAADDQGHIYAVWAQSSGSAQGLYLSAMSMTDDTTAPETWSKPQTLDWDKDGGNYLTDPSIAVDSDGTIILGHNAYNLENVTKADKEGDEYLDSRKHADDTFCVTVEKATGTPILEDAELSDDYPRAGEEFTVTATTGNDGFLAADKINVKAEFVQKKGETEKVLATKTQSFSNVRSGHRDEARLAFTMKQEYLDAAKKDQATYYIRLTASEGKAGAGGEYAETASATVDVKTGAHYVFLNENVDGFRCREITRDTEAGTIRFGGDTGENRYVYSVTITNDGNLPVEDMEVAMFVSNEKAYNSTRDKNEDGTYEGTAEELTEYYKTHSATESVVNNEEFNNWIGLKSFLPNEAEKSLGVGETADIDVVTVKIPDSMYSRLGAADLMMAVYDDKAADNAATKSEGLSSLPITIVEEENVNLLLRSGSGEAKDQTMAVGDTARLSALVTPLKAAPDYDVLWDSSDQKVATVDNGDVTAVGAGSATIKASLMKDGEEVMNSSINITVSAASADKPTTPAVSPKPSTTQTQKTQVTVSFKGNKGKVKGSAKKTVTVGEKYGKLPKATRKGYTFKGWYTAKSGGTKVTKDTKVTNKSAHSLYAQWKKVKVGKAKIKKLTAKKGKKLKVTIKSVKSADGYQICYSPGKKFSKKKTKKKNSKKAKVTLKKLKKGKTYYVKVRAYKLDSAGKKVYGKYSKVKKKKVSK